MNNRHIAVIGATLITMSFAAGPALSADDIQILPDGSVMIVQLEGTSEFCIDPQDRRTCRILENRCDFIVANKKTGQITEPEPISSEAILLYGGPESLPLLKDNSELLGSFKFGNNECNLTQTAKASIQGTQPPGPPFSVPPCTHCEEPVSAGQP
jgi:hypothetical protein